MSRYLSRYLLTHALLGTTLAALAACGSKDPNPGPGADQASDRSPSAVCARIATLKGTPKDDCGDYADLLKQDPKGFTCIAACSELKEAPNLDVCLRTCGTVHQDVQAWLEVKKDFDDFGGDGSELVEWKSVEDFMNRKSKTYAAKLAVGMGDDKMKRGNAKISLVEGYPEPGTEELYSLLFQVETEVPMPRFVATLSSASTVAEDVDRLVKGLDPEEKVTKKEVADASFLLHVEDESAVRVLTGVKSGDNILLCDGKGYVKSKTKRPVLLAWLEKSCKSAVLE